MRNLFKLNFLICLILLGLCIFGCSGTVSQESSTSPIPVAVRVGIAISQGDEVPIVFNAVTRMYEMRPISGGVQPLASPTVSYKGITN